MESLAGLVRESSGDGSAAWVARAGRPLPAELVAELAVWRAARGVDPSDPRPAGPPPTDDWDASRYHRTLVGRLDALAVAGVKAWEQRIIEYVGRRDDNAGELALRLDKLDRRGLDVEQLLERAAARSPLPDDHPSATLWYRIYDQLPPAVRPRRKGAWRSDPAPLPSIDRRTYPQPPAPGLEL